MKTKDIIADIQCAIDWLHPGLDIDPSTMEIDNCVMELQLLIKRLEKKKRK